MGTKRVTVRVTGTQREIDGNAAVTELAEERTEVVASGVYSFQNGKHFVIYDEEDEEGNRTRNTVKVYGDGFEVSKRGHSSARMVFRSGQRDESVYQTPYGPLDIALCVEDVRVVLLEAQDGAEQAGECAGAAGCCERASTEGASAEECPAPRLTAEASYLLEMNGQASAWCSVCVAVEPEIL